MGLASEPMLQPVLDSALAWLLRPGLWFLESLGFAVDSNEEIVFVIWASLYAYVAATRMIYWPLGRLFGFSDPLTYRFWLWVFPWRPFYRWLWVPIRTAWWEVMELSKGGGTSQWTPLLRVLAMPLKPGQVPLGRPRFLSTALNQYCGAFAKRHIVLFAGTRSGKTVWMNTKLTMHDGPALVIDPKSQMADVMAARLKRQGRRVTILAPVGGAPAGFEAGNWNPFIDLRRYEHRYGHDAVPELAVKMTHGLVQTHAKDNPFFSGAAREFLTGLILHVYSKFPPKDQNLVTVYRLLRTGFDDAHRPADMDAYEYLRTCMKANSVFEEIVEGSAAILKLAGDRTAGSVMITMAEQLQWLNGLRIRKTLTSSDFCLEDFKRDDEEGRHQAVFVCAPVGDLKENLAPYLRLIVSMTFYIMEHARPRKPEKRCAVIVDEAPGLGYIEAIASAAPLMAGYGVELIFSVATLQAFTKAYPEDWSTILSSADFSFWMGINDPKTAKVLEENLGTRRDIHWVRARSWWWSKSDRLQENKSNLMEAADITNYLDDESGRMIVLRNGKWPLKMTNIPHFSDTPVWHHEPDPDHKEPRPRRFTRDICRRYFPSLVSPKPPAPAQRPEDVEEGSPA